MATRNFEFRVSPRSGQRAGRFAAPADADIVIGTAVTYDAAAAVNELGLPGVKAVTTATPPVPGLSGIAFYEYIQYQGDDPFLTTFSDKDTVPRGKALQVISGDTVKVAFTNTADAKFLNSRDYAGRLMVGGTVAIGDLLTPAAGSGSSGFWAKVGTAEGDDANAWLVVTAVNGSGIEARMLF